jgi:hypothetical protein
MPYKYYNLVTSASPNHTLVTEFQELLNDQFDVASDIYDIQEETTLGSGTLSAVRVRITSAISSVTGEKLSDDFKQILFKDINHDARLGKKYYFSGNYWICTYSEFLNTLGSNCMVRRANNQLRWVDDSGTVYTEPCSIEYKISRPRDMIGTVNPVMPQGFVDVYCQLNARTKTIKGNQRFLFGPVENRVAFKVFGDGVKNFLNQNTMDDASSTLLTLSMGGNFVNHTTDDITNGIADRYLDYNSLNSGSNVGTYDIIVTPSKNEIIQSASAVYNVRYYAGSVVQSGSFIFSITGSSVPVANYTFASIDNNNFSVVNNSKWLENSLDVLCSGSSGSRVLSLQLRGAW